jgi:hypothetical protein
MIPSEGRVHTIIIHKNKIGDDFIEKFKLEVLYKKGGLWVDMGITWLNDEKMNNEYYFVKVNNNYTTKIFGAPVGSIFLKKCIESPEHFNTLINKYNINKLLY